MVTVADEKAMANYPAHGAIEFEGVKMRYRPTAGLALAGVNLSVRHGEKVGIVGRTGSGKSTLLMALYRMFDLAVRSLPPHNSACSAVKEPLRTCLVRLVTRVPVCSCGRENHEAA
jgi:ABC-type transport system involved in cytochrome bd biosynthesis fused ATPase/permease subunit